ncbi:MAG: hypothetical protein AAB262_03620, partial [Elusimicrobiota bacterium]
QRWKRSFFAGVLPRQRVQAFICGELSPERFEVLLSDASNGAQTAPLPPGRIFLLRDLPPDERERVLMTVLKRRLSRWESDAHDLLEEGMPLVEQFRGLGLPLPAGLAEETRLTLAHALNDAAQGFAAGTFGAVDEARSVLIRASAAGLEVSVAGAESAWSLGASKLLDVMENDFSESALRDLRDSMEVAKIAGLAAWRPAAQTRFFRLLERNGAPSPLALEVAQALGIARAARPDGLKNPEPA